MRIFTRWLVRFLNLFGWAAPKETQVVDEYDIYDPKYDHHEG